MILFTSLAVIGQHKVGDTITNDGTGYRISLIVALVLCVIAAVVIWFYDEKDVMGKINSSHEKKEGIRE